VTDFAPAIVEPRADVVDEEIFAESLAAISPSRMADLAGSSPGREAMVVKRELKSWPLRLKITTSLPGFVRLNAIAVELDLVQPVVADGYRLS
jgi:hypothetical protein